MSDYKIIERISLLTESERREFRKVIKQEGNQHQQKLFDLLSDLITTGKPAEKEKLYRKVFGTSWSSERDYLLRNVFRHLTDSVEDFLRSRVTDKKHEQRKELLILRRMIEAGQTASYEKQYSSLIKEAEQTADWDFMADLCDLNRDFLTQQKLITISNCEKAEQNLEQYWQLRIRGVMHELASAYVYQGFVQRSKRVLVAQPAILQTTLAFPEPDDVVAFFKAWQRVYEHSQFEQVKAAEQAIAILKTVKSSRINKELAELNLQGQIALGYFLCNDFEQSCSAWEQALKLPAIKTYKQLPDLLYNYTSTLLKANYYEKAAKLIDENKERLAGTVVEHRMLMQRAVCLLYMNNTPAALRIMNSLSTPAHDNDYLYGRCVWMCCFLAKGDTDMAMNEMQNFKQSRVLKRKDQLYYQPISKLFADAIRFANDVQQRKLLAAEIELKTESDKSLNILPLLWLKDWLLAKPAL
jgi:tetratricopeptide (TPR) repeat protein